jgi:hypothetical protein
MPNVIQPGSEELIDVICAELDRRCPIPDQDCLDQLHIVIRRYARSTLSYDEARLDFNLIYGETDIIERMRSIIECSSQPLPVPSGLLNSRHRKFQSWSIAEDIRLMSGIYQYGVGNWSTISRFVGNGRSRTQCAQRWTRSLNPHIQKDTWTPEEEATLIAFVCQFGNKSWSRIASQLGTRSDVQCRYHYHQMLKTGKQVCLPMYPRPCAISAIGSLPNLRPPIPMVAHAQPRPWVEVPRIAVSMSAPVLPAVQQPQTVESAPKSRILLSPIANIIAQLDN